MPMQESAIGTAAKWGLEVTGKPAEWEVLENFIGTHLTSLLDGVVHEANSVGSEFGRIISFSGEELVGSMNQEMNELLPLLNEQTAISFLREIFGLPQPEAPLAGEVFMALAHDEITARNEMKNQAGESLRLIQELRNRLVLAIKLRIVTRLNEVEASLKTHEQARARTLEISRTNAELSPLVTLVDPNFTNELDKLTEERNALYGVLNQLETFVFEIDQQVDATLVPTAFQRTAPTALAA